MTSSTPLPGFLKDLFEKPQPTWAQQACGHILSTTMPDGKHFCPSCRLVSDSPLVQR